MAPTKDTRLQVRIPDDLRQWLTERSEREGGTGSADLRARRELMRWRQVLTAELRGPRWRAAELEALARILADVPYSEWPWCGIGFMQAILEDRREEDPDFPLQDPDAIAGLQAKLRGLGPAANAALMDGIYRWRFTGLAATAEGFSNAGFRCSP